MALLFKKHICLTVMEKNEPPSDPRDIYYLTNCYVCGEKAKPEQEHIRNYGGIACFSCRAFFRRATHRSKKKPMICSHGGRCQINVSNRHSCKRCRYEKCLEAGMSPDAVLTDEQKVVRFRKLLSKKKQMQVASQPSENGQSTSSIVPSPSSSIPMPESEHFHSGSSHSSPPLQQTMSVKRFDEHLRPKIDSILHEYQRSVAESSLTLTPVSEVDESRSSMLRKKFLGLLVQSAAQFRQFANRAKAFVQLPKGVQCELLARCSPLYIQLMLAYYLTTPIGLLDLRDVLCLDPMEKLETMSDFFHLTGIFRSQSDVAFYCELAQRLQGIRLYLIENRAVLTHILLLDREIIQKATDEMHDQLTMCKVLYENCFVDETNSMEYDEVLSVLVTLSIIFSRNVETMNPGQADTPFLRNVFIGYTREEEAWLSKQVKSLDEAFHSVAVGEQAVHHYLMFSQGQSLPPEFSLFAMRIFKERIWRLLNIHSEFQSLPSKAQLDFLNTNGMEALVLISAHIETSPTGLDQLKECIGISDRVYLEPSYIGKICQVGNIKKVYIADHSTFRQNTIDPSVWLQHSRIVGDITRVMADPLLYKMLLLLTLTKAMEGSMRNDLAQLHGTYLSILQRRQKWVKAKLTFPDISPPIEDEFDTASVMLSCLRNISVLTLLHRDLINKVA